MQLAIERLIVIRLADNKAIKGSQCLKNYYLVNMFMFIFQILFFNLAILQIEFFATSQSRNTCHISKDISCRETFF